MASKGIRLSTSGGGDFEQPEPGSYVARCFKMIDLGSQPSTWQGKQLPNRRLIDVYWELLEDEDGAEVRDSTGKPFQVRKRYTGSLNKKANLRKDLDAWRGKPLDEDDLDDFDITVVIEKYARLGISIDEKDERSYVNVTSISPTKKEPKAVNEPMYWTVDDADMEVFETFPDWLKDKIKESSEWAIIGDGSKAAGPKKEAPADDKEDDINIDDVAF